MAVSNGSQSGRGTDSELVNGCKPQNKAKPSSIMEKPTKYVDNVLDAPPTEERLQILLNNVALLNEEDARKVIEWAKDAEEFLDLHAEQLIMQIQEQLRYLPVMTTSNSQNKVKPRVMAKPEKRIHLITPASYQIYCIQLKDGHDSGSGLTRICQTDRRYILKHPTGILQRVRIRGKQVNQDPDPQQVYLQVIGNQVLTKYQHEYYTISKTCISWDPLGALASACRH
ncbi:hypothetical protein BT96DRAFT_951237 [Gymnopus androsaceus JB14]|uniref:Uncharacterized protein n=1 Tax=Gymnopus androsaceus JB14 TaxID=1447944 RepID=A0A6A4GDL5_9AGAR|nr:hypothetical protein BT96DRAFT_951237 [Gymnopus androsaceus JB14]